MGHRPGLRCALALAAVACWTATARPAAGQGVYDLFYIGSSQPISDETGTNLLIGNAAAQGSLVQVIQVTDTNNPSPAPFNLDGTVNTNILLLNSNGVTAIGAMTSPGLSRPGTFTCPAEKPASGTKMFVRVFNTSNEFDATYYGDSQIYTFTADVDFDAAVGSTTSVLDNTDTDGDGLLNRWEIQYGTDPNVVDSDGDGMTDGEERRAGTDALKSDSYLAIRNVTVSGSDVVVEWMSVPGFRYKVEGSANLDGGEETFSPLSGVITGDADTAQAVISGDDTNPANQHIRILLWEYP